MEERGARKLEIFVFVVGVNDRDAVTAPGMIRFPTITPHRSTRSRFALGFKWWLGGRDDS